MMIKMTTWCRLQMQRLREQGVLQRIKAGIKKILKMLLTPCYQYIQTRPRSKKVILYILRLTGLNHRVKRLMTQSPPIQVVTLTARALVIRQELKQAIKQLEKTG